MPAYYNDNDPFCAEWLRNLIARGLITSGVVDERSILDVQPADLRGYTQCHFFAGIGGWSRALALTGWSDDRSVWTASCPCQPFSAIGVKRGGEDGRHLWPTLHNLIRECRPSTIIGEQVSGADGLAWLDHVCADLESDDYAVCAADLCAASVGAPHRRQRLYWLGDASGARLEGYGGHVHDAGKPGWFNPHATRPITAPSIASAVGGFWRDAEWIKCTDGRMRPIEPGIYPLANGVSARVGRLRAYGNAIVPQVAAEFIAAYIGIIS